MAHKVELTRTAEKELALVSRSDRRLYERFLLAFDAIARDPLGEGKPLKGEFEGLRSHRFGGYRVVYEVVRGRLVVLVIDLGPRRDIYR